MINQDYELLVDWLKLNSKTIKNGTLEMDNSEVIEIYDNLNMESEPGFEDYNFKIIDQNNVTRYHNDYFYVKAVVTAAGCEGEIEFY